MNQAEGIAWAKALRQACAGVSELQSRLPEGEGGGEATGPDGAEPCGHRKNFGLAQGEVGAMQRSVTIGPRFSWDTSGPRAENVGEVLVAQCPHRLSSLLQRQGVSPILSPQSSSFCPSALSAATVLSSHRSFSWSWPPWASSSSRWQRGCRGSRPHLAGFLAELGKVLAFTRTGPFLRQFWGRRVHVPVGLDARGQLSLGEARPPVSPQLHLRKACSRSGG